MYIYYNGKIQLDTEPVILSGDRGVLLGDGVFETLKIVNKKPIFLQEHLDRLITSCQCIAIPTDLINTFEIQSILTELVTLNNLSEQMASARITLTRGIGPRGLMPPQEVRPNLLISIAPYTEDMNQPCDLWVSSIRRNEYSPLSHIKSLCYLDNVLAKMEAKKHGADDALILNTQEFVVSTSVCNVFIIKDNILITPPVSDGVLPGIVRNKLLELAKKLHVPVQEKSILLADCYDADCMFITNSLIELRLIRSVGRQNISNSHEDLFKQIAKVFKTLAVE